MADITAQTLLDRNNWATTDINTDATTAKTRVEYLIDDAIDYINGEAGTSMSNMSGAAGSKSVTVTSAQAPIVRALAALLVRAYLDKGPNVSVGGMGVSAIVSDPEYKVHMMMIMQGISRLRGRSFVRT